MGDQLPIDPAEEMGSCSDIGEVSVEILVIGVATERQDRGLRRRIEFGRRPELELQR